MADLSLKDELRFRRIRVANTSVAPSTMETAHPDETEELLAKIPPPPPPLPPSAPKLDLRPVSMMQGEKKGIPHVDTIVQPSLRKANFQPPPANELQMKLAEIRKRQSIKEVNDNTYVSRDPPTPPESPEFGRSLSTQKTSSTFRTKVHVPHVIPELPKLSQPTQDATLLSMFSYLKDEMTSFKQQLEASKAETVIANEERLRQFIVTNADKKAEDYEPIEKNSLFSEPEQPKPSFSSTPNVKENFSTQSTFIKDDDNESMKSFKTTKSGILKSSKARSISFSIADDANEADEEIPNDDVFEIDAGIDDNVGALCTKFSISGPFLDDELNVVHAICSEYLATARMTLAKRSYFTRSSTHSTRVYGFLSSDRRSNWLNRNDWTSGMTQTRILDYLFRKTLRSKTLKINRPLMKLDGLDQNRTLTERRFRKIIKCLFTKRDELMISIVGNTPNFESIA